MKKFFLILLPHLCFWRHIGNEAKFSLVAFLPLFIAIFLPIAYPTLISLTYSNQSVVERKAIVLDLDNSALSRDLTLSIDATQGVHIIRRADSLEDGIEAVMSRETDAFIFFPEDFSSSIKSFRQGNLKVYIYATNMMIYAAAMTGIQQTVLDKNVEIAIENLANPKGITGERAVNVMDPIQNDKHILYAPTLAYSSYISPILFVIVFHQMSLLLLAFSIGYHREKDTEFKKKKLWYIDYFWRYLYYLIFIFIGANIVYRLICPIFGWPCDNPGDMIKLIMLLAVCQMPLSIILATFCKDRFTSFQFILGLSLFFFTMSGYVWPVYAMPDWIQSFSGWLGILPASNIMRKLSFKDGSLIDCTQDVIHLITLAKVYFVIALVFVHRDLPVRLVKHIWHKPHPVNAQTQPETANTQK